MTNLIERHIKRRGNLIDLREWVNGETELRRLALKRDKAWLALISIINIGANAVEIDPRYRGGDDSPYLATYCGDD